MHGVPIFYASGLASQSLKVYQTYIEMMNDAIKQAFQVPSCLQSSIESNNSCLEAFLALLQRSNDAYCAYFDIYLQSVPFKSIAIDSGVSKTALYGFIGRDFQPFCPAKPTPAASFVLSLAVTCNLCPCRGQTPSSSSSSSSSAGPGSWRGQGRVW